MEAAPAAEQALPQLQLCSQKLLLSVRSLHDSIVQLSTFVTHFCVKLHPHQPQEQVATSNESSMKTCVHAC